MSDITKYHIIKPKDIDNGDNACWINAPLFATSAHELIILQHFILDNSRLIQGELDIISIFIEKFLNINRLDNLPWNNNTYLDIYYILSDIIHGNYFFNKKDPVPQYGFYGPGDILLQKFMGMITKNFDPRTNKLCYLKTETRVCRNKDEFNLLIENIDNNRKFELISFIASVCTNTINNLPQKPPTYMKTKLRKKLAKKVQKERDMTHWNAYVLTNNGKWRYFNALKGKVKDINFDDIYNCSDDKGMHICCIYIDRDKLNRVMNLSNIYNSFKILLKYFNESKSISNIDIMQFYKLSNDFIKEHYNADLIQGFKSKSKSAKLSDVADMSFDSQVLPGSKGSLKGLLSLSTPIVSDKSIDLMRTSRSNVSQKITSSMKRDINILIKKNINLLKKEDIRKILIKLKVDIPLGTIDIRGLLINRILKVQK